jgi:hypothetical protein
MTKHHFDPTPPGGEEQGSKTLQELEGQDWGEPSFPSHLVRTCHALRRKPLRECTVEDLRIMIGQNISLPDLMPLAIEQLQRDPLAASDFYPGDLLANVLKVESGFWHLQPQLRRAVQAIVDHLNPFPAVLREALLVFQIGGLPRRPDSPGCPP